MARPGTIELPTAIFGEIEYLIKSSRQGSDRRLIEWPPSCSTERMTPISHQHLWSSNAVLSVSSSSRVSRLAEEITFWMTKVVPGTESNWHYKYKKLNHILPSSDSGI
jgi:hypothetical protein